jgi:hypothetical protein
VRGVSAKNITLNRVNNVQFGQGMSTAISCDPDGVIVELGSAYIFNNSINNSDFHLKSMSISGIADTCIGQEFAIYFYNNSDVTIENISSNQSNSQNSDIRFILTGTPGDLSAVVPLSYGAVDYVLDVLPNSAADDTRIKFSINTNNHQILGADVAGIGIEISNPIPGEITVPPQTPEFPTTLNLTCDNTSQMINAVVHLKNDNQGNLKLYTVNLPGIPDACKGSWIHLYITKANQTRLIINPNYSRVTYQNGEPLMDACDRQSIGSTAEYSFYYPEQNFDLLISGSTNSYTAYRERVIVSGQTQYLNEIVVFFAPQIAENFKSSVHLSSSTATCVKDPLADYYYPGY